MNVLNEILNKLSILEGFYDNLRVIDPINKLVFNSDLSGYSNIPCYKYFGKDSYCKNCICSKAFTQDNIFSKLENKCEDILLVFSFPIDIDNKIYIVEALKSLKKISKPNSFNSDEFINFKNVVNKLNNSVVSRTYGNNDLP